LDIKTLLEKFSSCNILIVGDVMVDTYLWGSVSRISPEAPVPVVTSMKTESRMGGAANVALNVFSLGAMPIICSVIGNDEAGKIFRSLLKNAGIPDNAVLESTERITTVKTRVIAGHQHLLRIDNETEKYLSQALEEKLNENIQKVVDSTKIDAIIFQDYDKGIITPGVIDFIIQLAQKKGIPTLVDPKKKNFNYYHHATLFKPNFKELTEGLNLHIDKNNIDAVADAAKKLRDQKSFNTVMVTLSENGMIITDNHNYHIVPAIKREVADVSGAGDTVIAMASLCLANGIGTIRMAELSNLAAGLVCEKVGVVPIEKEWLIKALA
jgi:rfaE bifunctional protein kinase chain/domain